jgi:hypothetical protein
MPSTNAPRVNSSSLNLPGNCAVEKSPDGGMIVHFRVDVARAARLRTRMGPMDPARYLWENIINRALEAETF